MADSVMGMNNSSTLQDYIRRYQAEEVTYDAFYLDQILKDEKSGRKMRVNFNSLVTKYMPELKKIILKVTLSGEDYAKYKYNPKLMSFDLYGTTELWFLLLDINELHSTSEFNLRTLYVFQSNIVDVLSRILDLESPVINYNEEVISSDLVS